MTGARALTRGLLVVFLSSLLAIGLAVFSSDGPRLAYGAGAGRSGEASSPGASAARDGGADPASAAPGVGAPSAEAAPLETTAASGGKKTLPVGSGLPLRVRAGLSFVDIKSFHDTKGEFEATVDVRLVWIDRRLAFDVAEEPRGFKEHRFSAADEEIEEIWTPDVELNVAETPKRTDRRLRIYANGRVELTSRTTARYPVNVDASRFPFDRQHLKIDVLVRENDAHEVLLVSHQDDVEWSRPASRLSIDGWTTGMLDIHHHELPGWNGDRYSRAVFALDVDRDPSSAIAPIFIPLVASLLIPLLAIWMNRTTKDGFELPAFEIASLVIGGLFSVIALSFAVYSSYPIIAGNDNTVTRLFALNYASLAFALVIVVVIFRFNVVAKLFGRHVHEEVYRSMLWAVPALSIAASVAIILAARA